MKTFLRTLAQHHGPVAKPPQELPAVVVVVDTVVNGPLPTDSVLAEAPAAGQVKPSRNVSPIKHHKKLSITMVGVDIGSECKARDIFPPLLKLLSWETKAASKMRLKNDTDKNNTNRSCVQAALPPQTTSQRNLHKGLETKHSRM